MQLEKSKQGKIKTMNFCNFISYIIVALLISASSCKSIEPRISSSQKNSIQKLLDSLVIQNEIPGLNFSFIDSKNYQQDFSAGYENISKTNKLRTSHVMFSGSVGKTYAAAITFQLVDEKRIKLDDKILTHLPNDQWLRRLPNIDDITIKMLLSHTSGLPRWVMKPEVWATLNSEPDKVWSYHDRLSNIFNEDPAHKAGEKWAYSDTNYLLLGFLIETLLNKDYYQVLNERIIQPRQLKNTIPSLSRKIENLALGYSQMPTAFKIPNEVVDANGSYVFNPQFEWTGGGVASTTSDLVKWVDIYYNSNLISESQRSQMLQVDDIRKNVYDKIHSYGMGTFIYTTKYGKAYGHSGFMPGYNTIIAFFPELQMSVAIQINCDYAEKKIKLTEYLEECIDVIVRN